MLNSLLQDRRLSKRVFIKVPVICKISNPQDGTHNTVTLITNNISQSGISLQSGEPFSLKTELSIQFKLPGSENFINAVAKIVRVETDEKMFDLGATFLQIAEKDVAEIEYFIARLDINKLLEIAIKRGASDVHLLAGHHVVMRVEGDLQEITEIAPLASEDIPNLLFSIMTRQQIKRFEQNKEFDMGFQYDMQNRFRINLHVQRGFVEATFRLITTREFSFEELNIPLVVQELTRLKEGLILVVGPTGSGKSTTMAAMVELINQERKCVIITLERPIEYVHTNVKSIIKQREIGIDTNSFSSALKSTLRQDPNVIVVGELDDLETVKTALAAAEAGYLVIASFHAHNTINAIDRLANIFPPENRRQVLSQISNSLKSIITQTLLPCFDKKKRVLAAEVLITNEAAKKVIRQDELIQLNTIIQTGGSHKMQSMKEAVKRLIDKNIVDIDAMKICGEN